jgi:hypothetical protein
MGDLSWGAEQSGEGKARKFGLSREMTVSGITL